MLSNGFNQITIGTFNGGSGAVAIESASFTDPVTVLGGSITVTGGLTGDGGISLVTFDDVTAGQDISVTSGTVQDASGDISLEAGDDVSLATGTTIHTPAPTAAIQIAADLATADAGTGAAVTIGGFLQSSNPVQLSGGPDSDTLVLASAPSAVEITSTGPAAGTIAIGADTYAYSSFELVEGVGASEDVRLTFATVGETISVDRPIAGRVRAVSTVGQTIVLDDPTNSLTVSTGTGSADVVNVSELSVAFPGGFVIRDEDGVVDDSIVLNGPLANTSGGVELTGSNVDLDFSVNAAGPLLVGAASAAGNVVIATADIISSGNQEYRHAVLLDASPTLIASNGALSFLDSVNSIVPATDDLSIVAGAAVNLDGEIGTATRLRSLDVDSTGQPITIGGDIVTSENQRYRDAVEVAGAAAIGLSSLVGEIRFDAALDDAIPESTALTLTAPSLMLGGSLGSTNRLLSVTLNPGGAFRHRP